MECAVVRPDHLRWGFAITADRLGFGRLPWLSSSFLVDFRRSLTFEGIGIGSEVWVRTVFGAETKSASGDRRRRLGNLRGKWHYLILADG